MYEYIQDLLINQNWLEFFVEGTRSRYGKTLAPKSGILTIVLDAVFDNKIPDAQIVPITLNYDRVLEGESFPYELLGEQKVKESLARVIKGANILAMNFGKVYINVCQPFSVKKYSVDLAEKQQVQMDPYTNRTERTTVIKSLGYEIVYQLNENIVVMVPAMVASLILLHRKGISEENLHSEVEWLVDQLQLRNVKVGLNEGKYSVFTTKSGISLLGKLISQKKDIFHIQLAAKEDHKNILLLSYYRNTLIHAFWNESIIACALSSFGQDIAWKEGVSFGRLLEEIEFLNLLVSNELQLREKINKDTVFSIIERMKNLGVLEIVQGEDIRIKVPEMIFSKKKTNSNR